MRVVSTLDLSGHPDRKCVCVSLLVMRIHEVGSNTPWDHSNGNLPLQMHGVLGRLSPPSGWRPRHAPYPRRFWQRCLGAADAASIDVPPRGRNWRQTQPLPWTCVTSDSSSANHWFFADGARVEAAPKFVCDRNPRGGVHGTVVSAPPRVDVDCRPARTKAQMNGERSVRATAAS